MYVFDDENIDKIALPKTQIINTDVCIFMLLVSWRQYTNICQQPRIKQLIHIIIKTHDKHIFSWKKFALSSLTTFFNGSNFFIIHPFLVPRLHKTSISETNIWLVNNYEHQM